MIMNENGIKEKWSEIKVDLKKAWDQLTDEDLEKTKGDIKAIGELIQQKYGEVRDAYSKKLTKIIHQFEHNKDVVGSVKVSLKVKPRYKTRVQGAQNAKHEGRSKAK